ncbi:pseudouridine synthase [Vagococcus elongatus]|uniref:Pseudouridine synthase n=1 Tax=Vagococcus elongatus TaxID=180344 RepID=A0A430AL66_9ENTE|nr:pseudouridine synthase [Vagococcus elongatus]RSU08835.1 16S rRNA pseudouridine(516) synthase [Vagococcus elongatus]
MKVRLDKMLSHLGYGSRKEVKQLLKKKEILVNGVSVKNSGQLIDTEKDQVLLNGDALVYEKYVYYMLHKPKGVISATEDAKHRTVLDLISQQDVRPDLFPVGRLDKDTTGLLLLTNDGALAHELLSPKKKVPKCYLALVEGIVTEEDVALFSQGFEIDGNERVQPSELVIETKDNHQKRTTVSLTIVEGKFHQVKRMFAAVGKKVLTLHRESMGGLILDKELHPGDYRRLTKAELEILKKQA